MLLLSASVQVSAAVIINNSEFIIKYAGVAQLVEQRIRKRKVIAAKIGKFNNSLLWLSW